MVNKEAKQKDGFGLPSTDVRKKDNALLEAARIADKVAKWNAEFIDVLPVIDKAIVEAVVDKDLEAQKIKDAEIAEALKKEAELAKAKADKVKELKKALAEAEKG